MSTPSPRIISVLFCLISWKCPMEIFHPKDPYDGKKLRGSYFGFKGNWEPQSIPRKKCASHTLPATQRSGSTCWEGSLPLVGQPCLGEGLLALSQRQNKGDVGGGVGSRRRRKGLRRRERGAERGPAIMGKGSMRATKPQMPTGCQPLSSPNLGQCQSPLKGK